MITNEQREKLRGWFAGRLPDDLFEELTEITVDREEITVIGRIPAPRLAGDAPATERDAALESRAQEFRERTREDRMAVAREAEHRFGRKVSWGVECGGRRTLFTHVAAPVMTRLRQPERQVLDTLIAGGVARSRSDALAWCVRLVQRHTDDSGGTPPARRFVVAGATVSPNSGTPVPIARSSTTCLPQSKSRPPTSMPIKSNTCTRIWLDVIR